MQRSKEAVCGSGVQLTYPDLEVVEGVLVDVVQLLLHAQGVVSHGHHVHIARYVLGGHRQAGRRHVRVARRLDLLNALELFLRQELDNARHGTGGIDVRGHLEPVFRQVLAYINDFRHS